MDVAPCSVPPPPLLLFFFFFFFFFFLAGFTVGRRPHEPSMKECAAYLSVYVGLALIFGLGVLFTSGGTYAGEFYAGWLVEYSLSIDNLFIFIIIMSKFAVPRELQQYTLMVGIVMALIMRGIFIAVGAAAIEQFSWVFYLFGAFLIYTAVKLAKEGADLTTCSIRGRSAISPMSIGRSRESAVQFPLTKFAAPSIPFAKYGLDKEDRKHPHYYHLRGWPSAKHRSASSTEAS